jgi:hypothetical protein
VLAIIADIKVDVHVELADIVVKIHACISVITNTCSLVGGLLGTLLKLLA